MKRFLQILVLIVCSVSVAFAQTDRKQVRQGNRDFRKGNYQEAEIVVDVRRHKANPQALYDATWNLLRVTRRGVDDPQERVSVRTKNASTLILIK